MINLSDAHAAVAPHSGERDNDVCGSGRAPVDRCPRTCQYLMPVVPSHRYPRRRTSVLNRAITFAPSGTAPSMLVACGTR
jgi:hypothetical protein